jgi:hypothetical protein
VNFKGGVSGLTRARFIVHFKDQSSHNKKRLILLPGSLRKDKTEAKRAVELMTSAGLME